jgi:hypothetical protein
MKNYYLFLLACMLFFSCTGTDSHNLAEIEDFADGFPMENVCELSNNPNLLGELSSFHLVDEESFVVSAVQPSVVVLFDKHGEQLRNIGRQGRGQFEYLTPSLVRSFNGFIYVWCSNSLKLIVFTKYGEAVKEYHFTRAVKDFAVHNNIMFIYKGDDPVERRIVSLYDLDAGEFLTHAYGERTNEHDILNSSFCAGAMLLDGGHLYFAPSDRTRLYQVNLADFSLSEFSTDAPGFQREIVDKPLDEFMQDVFTSVKYLFGSDVVTGLFKASGQIVMMAETGEIEMQGLDITDYSKRRTMFYVFDENNQMRRALRASPQTGTSSCLYASAEAKIYMLRLSDDLQTWSLFEFDVF